MLNLISKSLGLWLALFFFGPYAYAQTQNPFFSAAANTEQTQQNMLQNSLKTLESEMNNITRQLTLISRSIQSENQELTDLDQRQQSYQDALNRQQQKLTELLRLNYVFSQENSIKTWLNQEHPENMDRYFEYEKYLDQARINAVTQIHQLLDELTATRTAVIQKKANLTDLKSQKQLQAQHLKQMIAQKKQLLKRLLAKKESTTEAIF